MKKYINIFMPLSVALLPLSIVSCSKSDGFKTIPKDWLKITREGESITLEGFDADHQQLWKLQSCNELVIPSEVTELAGNSFSIGGVDQDAPLAIKKVDFELGCGCTTFGPNEGTNFNECANLETVIFPPMYVPYEQGLFNHCSKLSTLDFSNVCTMISYPAGWIGDDAGLPATGKIIVTKKNEGFANSLKGALGGTWTVIIK